MIINYPSLITKNKRLQVFFVNYDKKSTPKDALIKQTKD